MSKHKRFTQVMPEIKFRNPVDSHIFVDTESNWSELEDISPITRHKLRFGYAKFCRWNDERLEVKDEKIFYEPKQFWRWVKKCKRMGTCWVWAHNLAFDGTLLELWAKLQSKETNLVHFTDCDLPAFYQCQLWGEPFLFLDSLNIFRTSLSNIGKELGLEKMEMPKQDSPIEDWIPYCKRDVDVLAGIVEKWMQFIAEHKLGPMKPSLASQALAAYRVRFMENPINIHCNEHAIALERAGYFGGLVEPKFIGEVPFDRIYEFDVNSLYPYVMKKHEFPCLLYGFDKWPSEKDMQKNLKEYYCIAQCEIETTCGVYPVRYNGRLCFPHGRYWTVLHQPELERAYTLGHVRSVACVARYGTADLFSKYVDFFYGLRLRYDPIKDAVWHFMCKLFMNSLYGKFGQKRPLWEKYSDELLNHLAYVGGLFPNQLDALKEHLEQQQSHTLKFRHPDNDIVYAARRLLGQDQIMAGEGESSWSFPAISGSVTAYAREYVRNIQAMIPKHCLVYTDTDSFFVNARGRRALIENGMVDDKKLGRLKAKTENEWMKIYGPKDYETNNEVKLKGIRPRAVKKSKNKYEQEQWPGFKTLAKFGFPSYIDVRKINKVLKRKLLTCQVRLDGWTYPLLVMLDNRKVY